MKDWGNRANQGEKGGRRPMSQQQAYDKGRAALVDTKDRIRPSGKSQRERCWLTIGKGFQMPRT